tara:strand:- start:854 stop:1228 length:375 start_codon:yes stop_codon:yes gene_type:complete
MIKIVSTFILLTIVNLFSSSLVLGNEKKDQYSCKPKHAAAIRSNGIQTFKIKGDEKPVLISIFKGFLESNDMKYKLYEAGGRAFAFSPERAWVHFQDITVLDDGQLSFVMAVNSSISRYLCVKK